MRRCGHKESALGLVDARELAELLGVPRGWVYRAAEMEKIPSVRLGRYLKFDPEEVLEACRRRRDARN